MSFTAESRVVVTSFSVHAVSKRLRGFASVIQVTVPVAQAEIVWSPTAIPVMTMENC